MNPKDMLPIQTNHSEHKFTILCIDDETSNLKILSTLLRGDYQVIASKQASEGLAKAIETQPDLILLDVVMPEISGFELIVQLKNHPNLHNTPVIFITGLQSPADEAMGLKLGACDYIHKPFNASIVLARVKTHLEIVRQRRLLERYANIDTLTELPNRRKWDLDTAERIKVYKPHPELSFVGIIDIDHFKLYNDRYGHQKGDTVLRKVSNQIAQYLHAFGGHLYRCGGEEFFFFLPTTQETSIEKLLQGCLQAVRALALEHEDSPTAPIVTVSIGVATCSFANAAEVNSALNQADQLLYQVKHSTRNDYCCNVQLQNS
ncbi:response regulator receiver modulated diguanylate cyclase [Oceanospirillum multiglobuliferum]|nr:response regulator receiver modulated diguanylate cyclase [Oceanospirillum multiglobuliferum]